MLRPRFNLWLESDGQVVISLWRVRLLEAIRKSGSITAAAEIMQVPYRRAWERLHEMETILGFPLVETEIGGVGGGGAQLSPRAVELVQRFHAFAEGLDEEIDRRYRAAFEGGDWDPSRQDS